MAAYWVALLISFVVTAVGQVVYKYYARSRNVWHLLFSITLFAIAPFTSFVALQKIGIGMVFIGAAFSQVLILFLSKRFLHEQLTRDHVLSMGFIIFGLAIYAIGN